MDYEALKTELDAGHPVTGAYDADDALAAAELNAENVTINEAVHLDGLNLAIREAGKWTDFSEKAVLQTLAGTYDNQSMFEFMGLFPSLTGNNTLDLQGTYMSGLIADCVTEGSMGAGAALAISNFGEELISRATQIAGDIKYSKPVTADHITTARAL